MFTCINFVLPDPRTRECVSTGDKDALRTTDNAQLQGLLDDLGSEDIRLPPGAPCDNFQGYCDVFQKCRGVDADGPLARLKNLILDKETLNTIRDWIIVSTCHGYGISLLNNTNTDYARLIIEVVHSLKLMIV